MKRQCIACTHEFAGRLGKKYCSDACRFSDHNRRKRECPETKLMDTINSILKKNRRILKQLNPAGKTTLRRDYLLAHGFDFNYITHLYRTRKGNTYYFCYEYGYLLLNEEQVLLVTAGQNQVPDK